MTKDNCRLLLIRLKMEGWLLGKTKVFLKYYNEEYLSRLYETQVKKIIKVQCMMRAFLARKNMASKIVNTKKNIGKSEESPSVSPGPPATPKETENYGNCFSEASLDYEEGQRGDVPGGSCCHDTKR